MDEIKVGLIGFGTIGAGVAHIFFQHDHRLDHTLGARLRLVRIADVDLTTDRGVEVPAGVLTGSPEAVLDDPQIKIVVELVGGLEAARDFILRAVEAGKQVVTANKALLALHGNEIFSRAEAAQVGVFYEGAVAGGIPIIRSLREGLAANRILSLCGILNGTSNYILTRMTEKGEPYAQALAQAQAEGLAEADPSLDVRGLDAAHKLAILISLAFGGPLQFDRLPIEGISDIEAPDIGFAREFGYVIKLLAIAHRVGDRVDARVHPAMLPQSHVLAAVNGAFNAIHLRADQVGEVLFYGLGAGRKPTASAVVGDIIEAARNVLTGVGLRVPNLGDPQRLSQNLSLSPLDELTARYYIRFNALDKPGVLSKVSGVLAEHDISIESVIQKGRGEASVPVIMLTHRAKEAHLRAAMAKLNDLEVLSRRPVRYRIEDEP